VRSEKDKINSPRNDSGATYVTCYLWLFSHSRHKYSSKNLTQLKEEKMNHQPGILFSESQLVYSSFFNIKCWISKLFLVPFFSLYFLSFSRNLGISVSIYLCMHITIIYLFIYLFIQWFWWLNSGPHTCLEGGVLCEPCSRPFLLLVILGIASCIFFSTSLHCDQPIYAFTIAEMKSLYHQNQLTDRVELTFCQDWHQTMIFPICTSK
jgi:hypothetical protein